MKSVVSQNPLKTSRAQPQRVTTAQRGGLAVLTLLLCDKVKKIIRKKNTGRKRGKGSRTAERHNFVGLSLTL